MSKVPVFVELFDGRCSKIFRTSARPSISESERELVVSALAAERENKIMIVASAAAMKFRRDLPKIARHFNAGYGALPK